MPKKPSNKQKSKAKGSGGKGSSSADAQASATSAKKDQYQHVIPRFLLRRFQIGGTTMTKAEREKEYKRTGVDPEKIFYYDHGKKTIEIRSIATAFGMKNFYRDAKNLQDVDELEEKLAALEAKAAQIVQKIHQTMPESSVALLRTEVEDLRKFIFLMHYRRTTLSTDYWDPSIPENTPIREMMKVLKSKYDLTTTGDVWLYFLRYFLDTPHAQIVAHAAESYKKQGGILSAYTKIFMNKMDPKMDNFQAIAYQQQAEMFFLCIWEAADGTEFIFAENAFGCWEGLMLGLPCLHRIFIISPRIALVLRHKVLREAPKGGLLLFRSDFLDMEQTAPDVQYSDRQPDIDEETLREYKASPAAAKDIFRHIKLTHAQTHELNCIVLDDLTPTSGLTFTSKPYMLKTIQAFRRSRNPYRVKKKDEYSPLFNILAEEDKSASDSMSSSSHENTTQSAVRHGGALLLPSHISPRIPRYTLSYTFRAILLNKRAQDDSGVVEYKLQTERLVRGYLKTAKPASSTFKPQSDAELVEELSEKESVAFYRHMEKYVTFKNGDSGEVTASGPEHDKRTWIYLGAIVIGFVAGVAKVRYDLLAEMVPGVELLKNRGANAGNATFTDATKVNMTTHTKTYPFTGSTSDITRESIRKPNALAATMGPNASASSSSKPKRHHVKADSEEEDDQEMFEVLSSNFFLQRPPTLSSSTRASEATQELHSILLDLALGWDVSSHSMYDPAYQLHSKCAEWDITSNNFVSEYHRIKVEVTGRLLGVMKPPSQLTHQASLPIRGPRQLVKTLPPDLSRRFFERINALLSVGGYDPPHFGNATSLFEACNEIIEVWLGRAVGVGCLAEILEKRPDIADFLCSTALEIPFRALTSA